MFKLRMKQVLEDGKTYAEKEVAIQIERALNRLGKEFSSFEVGGNKVRIELIIEEGECN